MSFTKPIYHYGMSIEECLLGFEYTDSRYAPTCNYGGVSGVAVGLAFGKHYTEIQKEKPQLDELNPFVLNRLVAIRDISKELCEKNHIFFEGMMPLDYGKQGVVCDISEEHVIRMQNGKLPERPESNYILPALVYHFDPINNITFEVLEKVDVASMTQSDAQQIAAEIRENEGIIFWDQTPKNVGRDKKGKVWIIDPDSFSLPKTNVIKPKN